MQKKIWFLLHAVCFVTLILTGCARYEIDDMSPDKQVAAADQNDEEKQPGRQSEETGDSNKSENENKNTDESKEPSDSPDVECVWTLSVDDTISTKLNGYDFTCTLQVNAIKDGGTDETGSYNGEVSLSYKYEMENQGIKGNADGSGQDPALVFDLVPYDVGKYTDYGVVLKKGELPPYIPLITYDAMALGSFSLTGSGTAYESAGVGSWSKEESKTISVPFKIAVYGGQADILLPSVVPNMTFKGILTGTPK